MDTGLYRVGPIDRFKDPPKDASFDEKEKRTFRKGVMQHFKNYCRVSGIHGFSYLGENRMWYEHAWWIIVFTLGLSAAIYMIYALYVKWLQSPVLVSFATRNKPIYSIPFPAITICPVAQIDKSYFNLTKYQSNEEKSREARDSAWGNNLTNYMDMICPDYASPEPIPEIDPDHFFNVLLKHNPWAALPFARSVDWNGNVNLPFGELFKPTVTQRGLCYTFNRLSLGDIYSDIVVRNEMDSEDVPSIKGNNGKSDKKKSVYPRRLSFAGMQNGLSVTIVDVMDNNEIQCHNIWLGYTISIHSPDTIPSTRQDFLFMPSDDFTVIPIDPSMIMTSETIQHYEPDKRDCYFPSERTLKYFKAYTAQNCEIECLTNLTLKMCDCVEFYMPRENGTKICGPGMWACFDAVSDKKRDDQERKWYREEFGTADDDASEEDPEDVVVDCNCLPSCGEITYHSSVEPINAKSEQLQRLKKFHTEQWNDSFTDLQYSTVVLYFKKNKIATTERNELYGPNDFISNFGGLLGLFTGFSILSLMEIIYFVTLRIMGNVRLFNYWAGEAD